MSTEVPLSPFPGMPCAFWVDAFNDAGNALIPTPLRTPEAINEDDAAEERATATGKPQVATLHPWHRDRVMAATDPGTFWSQLQSLDCTKIRAVFGSAVYFCQTVDELDDDVLLPPTWEHLPMGCTMKLLPFSTDAVVTGWVKDTWQRLCCALVATATYMAEPHPNGEVPPEDVMPYRQGVYGVSCNGETIKIWFRMMPTVGDNDDALLRNRPEDELKKLFTDYLRRVTLTPDLSVLVRSNKDNMQQAQEERRRGHHRGGSTQTNVSMLSPGRGGGMAPNKQHPKRNTFMTSSAGSGSPRFDPSSKPKTPLSNSRRTDTSAFGSHSQSHSRTFSNSVPSAGHSRNPSHQRQDSTVSFTSEGGASTGTAASTATDGSQVHQKRRRGTRAGKAKRAAMERQIKSLQTTCDGNAAAAENTNQAPGSMDDERSWAARLSAPEGPPSIGALNKPSPAASPLYPSPPSSIHSGKRTAHHRQVSFQLVEEDDDNESVIMHKSDDDDDDDLPQYAVALAGGVIHDSMMKRPQVSADDILLYKELKEAEERRSAVKARAVDVVTGAGRPRGHAHTRSVTSCTTSPALSSTGSILKDSRESLSMSSSANSSMNNRTSSIPAPVPIQCEELELPEADLLGGDDDDGFTLRRDDEAKAASATEEVVEPAVAKQLSLTSEKESTSRGEKEQQSEPQGSEQIVVDHEASLGSPLEQEGTACFKASNEDVGKEMHDKLNDSISSEKMFIGKAQGSTTQPPTPCNISPMCNTGLGDGQFPLKKVASELVDASDEQGAMNDEATKATAEKKHDCPQEEAKDGDTPEKEVSADKQRSVELPEKKQSQDAVDAGEERSLAEEKSATTATLPHVLPAQKKEENDAQASGKAGSKNKKKGGKQKQPQEVHGKVADTPSATSSTAQPKKFQKAQPEQQQEAVQKQTIMQKLLPFAIVFVLGMAAAVLLQRGALMA